MVILPTLTWYINVLVRTRYKKTGLRMMVYQAFSVLLDRGAGLPSTRHRTTLFSQVERAQPKGTTGIARPWSKHSEGSSRAQKLADAKARKEGKAKDKKLEADGAPAGKKNAAGSARGKVEKDEFMAALKKRSEARFWDNDDALLGNAEDVAASAADDDEDKDDNDSSGGSGSEDDRPSQEAASGSDSDEEATEEGAAESSRSSKDTRKAGGVSDMDWLRSKVDKGAGGGGKATAVEDSGSESERGEDEGDSEEAADASEGGSAGGEKHAKGGASGRGAHGGSAKQAGQNPREGGSEGDGDDEEESGLSVGRLFVRNLPYTCTEDDLRDLFGSFGMLSEVHLPVDDVKRVRFSCTTASNLPFCFP